MALEWKLKRAQRQIDRLTGEAEAASDEASELRAEVVGLQRRLSAAPDETEPQVTALLAAGLGGLLVGMVLRRRRCLARTASPVEEAERILERVR